MKKMRKLLALGLALTMALALCACGARGGSSASTSTAEGSGEETAAADGQTWEFIIADTDSEEHSTNVAAKEFADFMAEKTDGRFQVRVSANGELGDDEELLKAVQLGTIGMYVGYNGIVSGLMGDTLTMFELPFLFEDGDHMLRTFNNGGLDLYNSQLEGTGYYNVAVGYEGARQIISTKKCITSLADIKGMKIRCGNVQTFLDYYNSVGSAPTTVQFGEVYTSLSQGVIDAVDHVITVMGDQKYQEVAKYLTIDYHIISPICYVVNENFWNTLPDDIKDVFVEGVNQMVERQTEIDKGNEVNYPDEWAAENGVEVFVMPQETRDEFKAASQSVYDAYEQKHPDLYEAAMQLVEDNR